MDTGADQCTCGGAAWTVLDHTGEQIRCDGYLKGQRTSIGPTLPVVSAVTCVIPKDNDEEPFLILIYQACYYFDLEQTERICLPYQAEVHGVKFDLTRKERLNSNDQVGRQIIVIEGKDIPLNFDGYKT